MRVYRADGLTPFLCINQPRSYVPTRVVRKNLHRLLFCINFLISMSKRSTDNDNLPQSKRRLTGFNPEWGSDFQFVL